MAVSKHLDTGHRGSPTIRGGDPNMHKSGGSGQRAGPTYTYDMDEVVSLPVTAEPWNREGPSWPAVWLIGGAFFIMPAVVTPVVAFCLWWSWRAHV